MSQSGDNKMTRREVFNIAGAAPVTLAAVVTPEVLAYARPVRPLIMAPEIEAPTDAKADAVINRLVDQAIEADTRRSAFDEEADAAFDRIESVPIPEALEHRRAVDFPYICSNQNLCASYRTSKEASWRSIYESEQALTPWAQRWLRGDGASLDRRFFTDAHHKRMQEIAAALEQWNRDRDRAEAAAGYTAPAAAAERESRLIDDLLAQIALLPAQTAAGLAAKVRAATVARSFFPADARDLQELVRGPKPDWDKAFMISLFIDAARLGQQAHRCANDEES